jgi:tRNA(Ile)-lysidine synthase
MLDKLKSNIASLLENKKTFLATSGGLDSIVMAHLFKQLNYEIALAHCNFQLRG